MIMEKVMNDHFMPHGESSQFNGTVGVSNHDSLGRSPFCAAPDGRMLPDIQPRMETGCISQLQTIHRIKEAQGEEKNKA